MKRFRLAIILGAIAAAALAAAAVTAHADAVRPDGLTAHGWRSPTIGQPWNRQGGGATAQVNPQAVKALQELRDQQVKDMQAWWSKYGQNPTSAAAQKALTQLRDEHRTELQQLLKKYGLTLGRGSGCGRSLGEGWRQAPGMGMQGGFGGPLLRSESL
jgi:opacity protein-like surface antigen